MIGFSDLLYVKDHLKLVGWHEVEEGVLESQFSAKAGLGERLKAIVDQATVSDGAVLQSVLLEFVKALSLVCLGSDSAAAIDQYWANDNQCPLTAVRGGVVAVTAARYTSVVLGQTTATIREKVNGVVQDRGHTHKVEVSLHRMATFLARGHPPPAQERLKGNLHEAQANHKCGNKLCLRLGCLKWGTFTTNLEDAYEKEYEQEYERSQYGKRPWDHGPAM